MFFSVIIPAYNAEKYIANCIDSVTQQDFPRDEYEIIIVDDCSPDDQNSVIEEYIHNHPKNHIRLIKHAQNKRQGGARNTAMQVAQGEYVFFLDSDDFWIRNDVFATFHRLLNEYDCDIIESRNYVRSSDSIQNVKPSELSCKILTPEEYYSSEHHPCIWASVYKKSLIRNIKFRENVYYEDCDWKIHTYTHALNIGRINFNFYFYSINYNSTTHQTNIQVFRDNIKAHTMCNQAIINSNLSYKLKKQFTTPKKGHFFDLILQLRNYSYEDGMELLNELNCNDFYKDYKRNNTNLLDGIVVFLSKYFPKILIKLLHICVKIKRSYFVKKQSDVG